ncbi:MAG: hypothetical protein L6R38_006156 [Xanthoria sp. 2 TBL-2021]|nr:MAG: hypothetical protein L6R38_006156 [Xanthoria sp. 2 TBL-2021]
MCRLVWASFSDLTTGDISQENISVMYVVQRGKESPAVGYKDIPADLYLLGFSLNVDTVTTKDYKERYTMFIVEPFKDFLSKEILTGPYLTLSHRWGIASILKLEHSKIADLEKGFNITDLPRTFQDAVVVTKRLGCKYIWIDSLCIIQDSIEDWAYEAGMMSEVYTNALCSISATGNFSSDDGCFQERNASDVEGLVVNPRWTGLQSTIFRVIEYGLWDNLVTSAPLNKRAWVVQERLLAPCVLHFGRTQLAWECHELDACESYPAGLPLAQQNAQSKHKGLDPDVDGKELQSMGDSRSSPKLYTYHLWNKIITAYTAGELTVASDKLVAMSGLAKKLQASLQDEYLAGLWKGTLSSGLLWKVMDGKQANGLPSTRAGKYRAPSWSWAALDGHIMPGRPNIERILIAVQEAMTVPLVPGNPMGQLSSGWIRLRGALLPGFIAPPESSALQSDRLSVHFPDRNVTGDQWIFPDVQDEDSHQPVFCLLISTKNLYDGTLVLGLALRCIDPAINTYRRVGLFEGTYKSSYQDLPIHYSKSARRVELVEDAELKTIVLI